MKQRRRLTMAIILLLVSSLFVTSASYAWFSLAQKVTATGITLGSTAPDNLLIRTESGDWSNSIEVNNATGGKKIYPASTADGINFYSLTDDGNAINGDLGGVVNDFDIGNLRFQANNNPVTNLADGYYTSYTLYIKTLGSADVEIYVDKLISKSEPHATVNIDDCIRIAIFKDSVSADNLIGIYDAGDQDIVHPVASLSGTTATLYDKDTPADGEPDDPKSKIGSIGPKITVPGGGTSYVTLIVNVWIEGQNYKCKNVLAGDTFEIDLKFDAVQPY